MARARVLLDTPDGRRHFPKGTYLIGRSDECEVVLASGRCSRRHARLLVTDDGATLEDLGSANGTFVNGVRITGPHSLADGDFVVVGGELGLEVSFEPATEPPEPLRQRMPSEPGPHLPPTTKVSADEVLEMAADHLFEKGHAQQAERTLQRWLDDSLARAKSGVRRDDAWVAMSLRCATKLARALPARRWVDYALELSTALSRPLELDQANQLNEAIATEGVSEGPLARYATMLRGLSATPEIARALDEAEAWQVAVRPEA